MEHECLNYSLDSSKNEKENHPPIREEIAMARLYPMLLFALLVLMVPVESAGQYGQLAKLSEVGISVESLTRASKELGLTKEDIKNHVFVFLRSKLPRLEVKALLSD